MKQLKQNLKYAAVAPATLVVSTIAHAQEASGVDISSATDQLSGLTVAISTIGGILLGAVATIAVWRYMRAAVAS